MSQFIDLSKITIEENRIRKEFDPKKMQLLKESILKLGLLHPIVVDSNHDGTYVLKCGECRLRAMTQLHQEDTTFLFQDTLVPSGYVPATFLSSLTDEQKLEAELEENIRRSDLSWQEVAEAQARLHEFRLSKDDSHTMKATAEEVGTGVQYVDRNVFLAKHLDDPDVAKAKTVKEAYNIATRKMANLFSKKLLELTNGQVDTSNYELIKGDALQEMKKMEQKFHVIITDPPYGIDADTFAPTSNSDSGLHHQYKDSEEYAEACYLAVASDGFRLTHDQAHAYIFFDMRHYTRIVYLFEHYGWDVHPYPIIWDKTTGMLGNSTHFPRRTYETILFCTKGDKPVTGVHNDLIRIPYQGTKLHAAEKPVDLYIDLLRRSVIAGDYVFDPFAGSGTIFAAAKKLALKAVGIELNEEAHTIAASRLASNI